MQREKHIKSGPLLEVDFYPITQNGRRLPERAPKSKPSTKEQKKYNHQQAIKKAIRMVNANFDGSDILMHITYSPEAAPGTYEAAKKDIANYMRRVKRFRTRSLEALRKKIKKDPQDRELRERIKKLSQPFKFFCTIERQEYKSGERKGKVNWHFHLFISGMGPGDRDRLEGMWHKGMRVNADRFQPETFGPEAAATYIAKDPQGKKRYFHSRNLDKPKEPPPKDGKITRRGVERLARERVDDREYWEKRYKGYRFLRCFARVNPFNGHWYVSVVMYKAGASPPLWDLYEDWEE